MSVDFLYRNALGRSLMKYSHKLGVFKIGAWFMKSRASKVMIPHYIKKYEIDMTPFGGQKYNSFSDFFCRFREDYIDGYNVNRDRACLISPCDGLLSYYEISDELVVPMKGSHYRLEDIVDRETGEQFSGGLFLVFRLQANDYHHFCSFDNLILEKTSYIPGQLHSVQPVACESVPVYRLNRRWWSLLSTENFQTAVQVEIGAMMVGGVKFVKQAGRLKKGEEMGNFELAGSTIVLLLNSSVREKLAFEEKFAGAAGGASEVPVIIGEKIGLLKNEDY